MSRPLAEPPRAGADVRVLFLLFFAGWAVQLSFWGAWLLADGLDPGQTSLVIACGLVSRGLSVSLVFPWAARRVATVHVHRWVPALSLLGFAAYSVTDGVLALCVVSALCGAVYPTLMPLYETYLGHAVVEGSTTYGAVRLWGSLGFVVGLLACAATIRWFGAANLDVTMVGTSGLLSAYSLARRPGVELGAPRGDGAPVRGLLRRAPGWLPVLVVVTLLQGSHGAYYAYAAVHLAGSGVRPVVVSVVLAAAVVFEVVAFRLSSRFTDGTRLRRLLLIAWAGTVTRWLLVAAAPNPVVLALTQPLHGMSFALTHAAYADFVRSRLDPVTWPAAHGAYACAAMSVGVAVGTSLAGLLFGRSVGLAYLAMALLALPAGLLIGRLRLPDRPAGAAASAAAVKPGGRAADGRK